MAERRWRLVRAGRDALPDSVRRFGARARRNRLRAAAPFLAAAGVLAVLAAGFAVVFATPAFAVARVVVRGTLLLSDEDIRAAAAVRPGTPLARVDVSAVHRRVAALPAVRLVRVNRKPPGTVVIRVTERTAAAVVAVGDGLSLIDASGVVFARPAARAADLALLKLAAPGPGDPSTRAALSVLAALPPPVRALLGTLVADAPARIRLELTDGRTIIWGDSTQNDLKARYAAAMLGKPGKVIDVSAPNLLTTR